MVAIGTKGHVGLFDKIRIKNHERASMIILTTVLQLQVFRRLSTPGYMGLLLLAYIYWFCSIKITRKVRIKPCGLIFLFSYLLLPIISLFNLSTKEYSVALIRFGALFPYVVICMLYSRIVYDYLEDLVAIFTFIVIASAILMIYQVPFGRISFFVEANNRVGFERYGSLLGSTTAYGTSSIIALFYLSDFDILKGWKKASAIIVIIVGGILCLSKSFFINVALGVGLIILFHRKGQGRLRISINKILKTGSATVIVLLVLYAVIQYTFVGKYFRNMFAYSFNSDSLGVEASLINRLTLKPGTAFQYHRLPFYYYIFMGVGFKGYSGVLGLPQYPMCHNNYFDILLSQGVVGLLSYLGVHVGAFVNQIKKRDAKAMLIKKMVPYKLINMLAGLGTYLTVGGVLSLVIIFAIYNNRLADGGDD